MDRQKQEEEAKKLCDEVIATISVAVNLHVDRRVARVVSRTLSREKIFKECLNFIATEGYDDKSRYNSAVFEAHANLHKGRDK